MNQDIFYLKEIVNKEKELDIYRYRVFGIPFWRIVRFIIRTRYLSLKTGFQYNTTKKNLSFKLLLINFLVSFFQYLVLFSKRKRYENIVFAFPRLQKLGDQYIDKFTDPIVVESKIKNNCIIFQRPLAGNHKENRINSEIAVKTDFIEVTSKILGMILFPFIGLFYFRTLIGVYKSSKEYFLLKHKHILFFILTLSNFSFSFCFHYILFKKLKPKRIFLVDREIFFPIILACKRLKINVYEIQHGVTHGETAVYSGKYDESIDPDFFLAFGEAWIGPQFGMPLDRIINIGWAYKDYIKGRYYNIPVTENSTLVIPEPHITEKIISITKELALLHNNITFHIRLHPQESLNDNHKNMLSGVDNIFIQDNTVESTLAIMSYKFLLGENSSVLYEALSFGKKVGRINYGGLLPELVEGNVIDGFYYLNGPNDFNFFINSSINTESKVDNLAYSDFDKDKFNSLT
jgi:hypothetical protein